MRISSVFGSVLCKCIGKNATFFKYLGILSMYVFKPKCTFLLKKLETLLF